MRFAPASLNEGGGNWPIYRAIDGRSCLALFVMGPFVYAQGDIIRCLLAISLNGAFSYVD